ncbi:septal ring lytic transglycosylase RlpA family protein [Lewinella sp. 4G2]|uniref:septal ring lytic transglycosylase RlpA family protein n=1 Tax=Lewinella sp. 4G2 TaxID=1803372 RepID=UPI0007B4B1F4|nr:septal ring lytic transglycosylase RlpA family protein [Lewinella sp. 4G2]OAV43795.1 hypothetical protein A3850_004460 [Lewinella sp. 4G2]
MRTLILLTTLILLSTGADAQTRMATYYHQKFYGRLTSTGEKLNPRLFTAASKQYDWGTILEVTNLDNGRTTQVRVNDCGPHAKGNILDLSQAAAEELDMIRAGRVPVSVKVIRQSTAGPTCSRGAWSKRLRAEGRPIPPPPPNWKPGDTPSAAVASAPPASVERRPERERVPQPTGFPNQPATVPPGYLPADFIPAAAPERTVNGSGNFRVLVGTYEDPENARKMALRLSKAAKEDVVIISDGRFNRVYAGQYEQQRQAEALRKRLKRAGFKYAIVRDVPGR